MDATPNTGAWPRWPYRGLDYYREADAALFGGRASDIKSCASLLLGFGVKLLLLQGSSGSGKSSFIRAGLIPFLKHMTRTDHRHQSFFLSSQASVIRCTIDPLAEIGRALTSAIERESPFTDGFRGQRVTMPPPARAEIGEMVRRATNEPRIQAHEALVDALGLLASDLPGRLILILDQAEEVLTRSDGTSRSSDDAATGFFRFLEDVYLRNVDVRIIVSLRTEYYGRFRDELAISDNRFSSKANRGGVEPYLLRPLRNPDALKEIVLAPTEPDKPYNFSIDERLAERIVRDLLEQLPSSVTPALQVVCSSLYMGLNDAKRRIVERDYDSLGRLQGIIRKYLRDGIAAVEPASEQEAEAWHFLLHSLVSRQGGGTVVSLTESAMELETRGVKHGIAGPVKPRLIRLSTGRVPLLRAEPPNDPQVFSLKHDVLAIILQRWFDEHEAAIRAREEERTINERLRARDRRVFWGVVAAFVVVIGVVGFVAYDRGRSSYEEQKKSVALRNAYAERAPRGDYRQSLLLMLANLKGLSDRTQFYEQLWAPGELRDATVEALRHTVPRVPRFAGSGYLAAGVDGQSGRLALLKQIGSTGGLLLEVLSLPADDAVSDFPSARAWTIPADRVQAAAQGNMFLTNVGFLSDIGPAVYIGGRLFFWDESGRLEERDVVGRVHEDLRAPVPRGEFVAGQLQLIHINWMKRDGKIRGLRLASDALKANPIPMQDSYTTFDHQMTEPLPVTSNYNGPPQYSGLGVRPYTTADLSLGLPVEKPASNENEQKPTVLSAWLGRSDGGVEELPLAVIWRPGRPASPLAILERRPATLNFVEGADALVYKIDGPEFHIIDIANANADRPTRRTFTIQASERGHWEVHSASTPFLQPPLAAARSGEHWRAAWLADNGVWSVETERAESGAAVKNPQRPLLAGDTGGVRLQFALQGNFLVLIQQNQWGSPISIQAWDLRGAWREWVSNANQRQLVELACKMIRSEGASVGLSEVDAEQFQIPGAYRNPCSMGDTN